MGRAYHSGEMATQITTMNQMMYGRISSANHVIQKIDEFVYNKDLQGVAYDSLRERMLLHAGTHRGIKYGAEAFIRANNYVQQQFLSMVGGDYVNTDRLEESMRMLYNSVYQLDIQETNLPSNALLSMFYRNQIKVIQKVIDDMEQFNASIRDVYNEALEYYRQVAIGLSHIENDGWNATTKTFASVDMSWSLNIEQQHFDQELAKYVKNGEITEEGYVFYEKMMNKDVNKVSIEQLKLLTELNLTADSAKEVERLANLGYCIEHTTDMNPTKGRKASEVYIASLLAAEGELFRRLEDGEMDIPTFRKKFFWLESSIMLANDVVFIADHNYPLKVTETVEGGKTVIRYIYNRSGDTAAVLTEELGKGAAGDHGVMEHIQGQEKMREKYNAIVSVFWMAAGFFNPLKAPHMDKVGGGWLANFNTGQKTLGQLMKAFSKKEIEELDKERKTNYYTGTDAEKLGKIIDEFQFVGIVINGKYTLIPTVADTNASGKFIPGTQDMIDKVNGLKNSWSTDGIYLHQSRINEINENFKKYGQDIKLIKSNGQKIDSNSGQVLNQYTLSGDLEDLKLMDYANNPAKLELYYVLYITEGVTK